MSIIQHAINEEIIKLQNYISELEKPIEITLNKWVGNLYFQQFYLLQDYLKISNVLLTVLLSQLMTVHCICQTFTVYQDITIFPTKSPDWTHDRTIDWILDSTIDCIVTNYIMTNCIKIQHNFLRYYKLY